MYCRIAGFEFTGPVIYQGGETHSDLIFTVPGDLTEAERTRIQEAKLFEVLNGEEVIGSYQLVDWRRVEKVSGGYQITWQTIRLTELDELKEQVKTLQEENEQLRQDNEDLTQGLLELADIVGGNENA